MKGYSAGYPFWLDKLDKIYWFIFRYDPVNWIQWGSWKYVTNRSDIQIKNFWVYSTGYSMKILVFYVDKQYFNMVILFLRLRVRRELIIRRDGRAVEGTGLENRRCESIRGFESHSLRQLNFSIDLRKYPRGRRGSPAKGVGRVKSAAEVQILSSAPRKTLKLL